MFIKIFLDVKFVVLLKSISIECDYENCKIVDKKYEKICVVENISDQWSQLKVQIYIKVIFIF